MPNIYPSLDSHGGALTEAVDIIPAIIKHCFAQPGKVSNIYDNVADSTMMSIRNLEAIHGTQPKDFCSSLQERFLAIFNRYFPNKTILPVITYQMLDDQVQYTVIIDVQERQADGSLTPLISSTRISIDPRTHALVLKYTNEGE